MIKNKKNIPEGIWILSIFSFVWALVTIGIARLSLSLIDNPSEANLILASQGLPPLNLWNLVFVFIFMLVTAALGYLIGRGLLKSQNWARIAMGTLITLGLISCVFNFKNGQIAGNLFGILVNGLIIWYLFIKDSTKKYFK